MRHCGSTAMSPISFTQPAYGVIADGNPCRYGVRQQSKPVADAHMNERQPQETPLRAVFPRGLSGVLRLSTCQKFREIFAPALERADHKNKESEEVSDN